MTQVVEVEYLQVDTARTESSEAADLVDDLVRRAGQASSTKVVAAPPDRFRPGRHLRVVPAAANRLRHRVHERVRLAAFLGTCGPHPLERLTCAFDRGESDVELVRVPGREL